MISSNDNPDSLILTTPKRSFIKSTIKTTTPVLIHPEPLLITPSKANCSRPLFFASSKQKKNSPSKFELKVKIKRLQQSIRRQKSSINNLKDLLKDFKKIIFKKMMQSKYY